MEKFTYEKNGKNNNKSKKLIKLGTQENDMHNLLHSHYLFLF
jgi:hypothetical protein